MKINYNMLKFIKIIKILYMMLQIYAAKNCLRKPN